MVHGLLGLRISGFTTLQLKTLLVSNVSVNMINYSFAQLFNIRNLVKVTLEPQVWNRVRNFGINSRRRGVRARRKFRESRFKQTGINIQNLIAIPRTNTKSSFELKFGTVNAMSLNNKSLSILETVLDLKLDILFITKTWIMMRKLMC